MKTKADLMFEFDNLLREPVVYERPEIAVFIACAVIAEALIDIRDVLANPIQEIKVPSEPTDQQT